MINRKIKVAYVSHFSHIRMGGQKSMVHLIENLNRNEFEPIAICPEKGELSEKLESINCPTFFVPLLSLNPKHYFTLLTKTYRQIKKIIINENVDIIHPDRDSDTLFCGFAKKSTKAKMVWHVRVNGGNTLDKINFSLSDGVIGVSEAAGERFKGFKSFKNKFTVIFNGVDTDKFIPIEDKVALRRTLRLPMDRFILIFVGQIKEGKGVFDIANAMKILKDEKSGIPLLLYIGTPKNEDTIIELKKIIEENSLQDDIKFVPQQKEIKKWMQASDALIIPSFEGVEGMPRVLYEAMACGIVGIGSDTSGVRETVTQNSGMLVKEKNPRHIAQKIKMLMSDKDLINYLSENGRKRAVEYFDIRIHTREIENYYQHILSQKGNIITPYCKLSKASEIV